MKTLIQNKTYQEVVGNDPDIAYRYIQDGRYFDDAGNEIGGKADSKDEADPLDALKSKKK